MDTQVPDFVPDYIIDKYVRYQLISRPYEHLSYNQFESAICFQMSEEASVEQQELFCVYTENCIVEPEHGWALSKDFQLIAESYPYGRFVLDQFKPVINPEKFEIKRRTKLKRAVLLWENHTNYFHFLNDFVGRLSLLDRLDVMKDIPIIVPALLESSNFFKQYRLICPNFFKRNWVFQTATEYFDIEEATYFIQNMNCKRQNFQSLLSELQIETVHTPVKKIFITRRGANGRDLTNSAEIEKIAAKNGFEIVDTAELTISEQIRLFTNATHIVGVHGAGLTNMIYCKRNHVKVIEIFPGNFYQATYYWLASQFGHEYDCLRGSNTESNELHVTPSSVLFTSNFYLDPNAFSKIIEKNT
jgi:hypothetical protein